VPESLRPFVEEMTPGSDLFPEERVAGELIERLRELGDGLKRDGAPAVAAHLSSSFRGARLEPTDETAIRSGRGLEIRRGRRYDTSPRLDPRAFARELASFLGDFRAVEVAETLVPVFDLGADGREARTEVRYDLVGPGHHAWRVQRNGTWSLRWRLEEEGWRITEWVPESGTTIRAPTPVFTEVTASAFSGTESFRRQLTLGFDAWAETLDQGLARDSSGHHGIAAGDADGDGLDDLYVAQPYGFPDRLYRARGDGTFEDLTEAAGLGTLEDTQSALFVDVDNDGDQDLILATSSGPILHRNDGTGRFSRDPGAFRFAGGLEGAPMSMAVADYDRDGFLDLYLCVYSFYYGAGEGRAGTPAPYHDAVNGPRNVLFRNDGKGGFDDATAQAGLDQGNDRFTFAAAWGDYDGDGWPDLVVANDFGRKNLYRNLGRREGVVRFEDVAARAGAEDHAAGMSILWLDYDGDGLLDVYGGQMWSDNGLRVTASPRFMPSASEAVHALYRHHARGNTLLRNRGDGTFEDVSVHAGVEMGRWTWSSGALDFDADGWEDLYAVNGMVTRQKSAFDLDWMFWGGVVARSPVTRATGTAYDDAWRALKRLNAEHSVAGHQRNVLLRNAGEGTFDDVSGAIGLDLDEDGRAFAVLDFDGDGDPDVFTLSPRGAPQLRAFRDDCEGRGRALAVRLVGAGPAAPGEGTASTRDAIGARVSVETDRMKRVRVVAAGSGFLSQHSKELLFGLGESARIEGLTVEWPSGRRQEITDVPLDHRVTIVEGGEVRVEPFAPIPPRPEPAPLPPGSPPAASWLFEPFPAPDFVLPDLDGEERTLAAFRGRPALVSFWAAAAPGSDTALRALADGAAALSEVGIASLAVALDLPGDVAKVRAAAKGVTSVPVVPASEEVALSWAIAHRHLFMSLPDMPLPSTFLLDAQGRIVRVYRGDVDVDEVLRDAPRIEAPPGARLARARPFEGTSDEMPAPRDYVPYGRELLDQGLEAQAAAAFELAAEGRPDATVLYRLGSLLVRTGETQKARRAYERALSLEPDLAEASNDLGTLLAQDGDLPGAIARFQAALAAAPDYPDALNNLGYAFLLTGRTGDARTLYEKALALEPDFPEALNNLGLILARGGDLDHAREYFEKALLRQPGYAEAVNNLALVLVSREGPAAAVRLLEGFLEEHPEAETTALTLAKVYLASGQEAEGLAVLDRMLRANPGNREAEELRRRFRP